MRGAFRLLAVLCAGPVAAQDLVYSEQPTGACLAAGAVPAAVCVGRSAEACINATEDGKTTMGMIGCYDRERVYWDGRLNVAYGVAMTEARRMDVATEGARGVASREEALREMQRAWLPFRDRKCHYARTAWGGGSGGGPATVSCLMTETAKQALWLEMAVGEG